MDGIYAALTFLFIILCVGLIVGTVAALVHFATGSHLIRNPFRGDPFDRSTKPATFIDAIDFASTLPRWRRAQFLRRWGNDKIHPNDAVTFHMWWDARKQLGG